MMWFLLLLYIAHIEQVITQADVTRRLILDEGPCEGKVKVYNGTTWSYVGDKYWNGNTEKVVCRSTHCGEPVEKSTEDVSPLDDIKVWLNEMECNGTESHLWDCKHPGWGISFHKRNTVKKMKCSNNIKIDLDGFKCAGAVRYSTDGKTPSGYFCAENWGKSEFDHLCESLGCGAAAEFSGKEWMVWEGFTNLKKMKINCPNKQLTNLWQCAIQESTSCQKPASVICQNHARLQLRGNTTNVCSGKLEIEEENNWIEIPKEKLIDPNEMCRQMYCGTSKTFKDTQLTCSDNVEVVLMGNSSSCYGNVHIKVNNSRHPVCASSWTDENSKMVCRELECGSIIETKSVTAKQGIIDSVNCMGKESSLWHCRAKHHNKPFPCVHNAYVVCSGSIEVKLTDGPGKCAGRLEIWYEGQWKKVSKDNWKESNSDIVCKQLKCGNARERYSTEKFSPGLQEFLQKKIECEPNASHISECKMTDGNSKLDREEVGIICEEHKVVFLEDSRSCSGKVGIEHGNNIYWLSGSKSTWNQESANTVCRELHCGTAQSFSYTRNDDRTNAVSKKSYSCPSNTTSLFDCDNNTLPSDHNETIATVKCSGNIHINLTNKCWGTVNICADGKCGGVCADTWTQSMKLCKQLECGTNVSSDSSKSNEVIFFKSVHMSKMTDNLTKCSFVENDGTCTKAAYVVCSGSVKPRLNNSDKCSGNLEMKYGEKWLPVCINALKDNSVQNTICEELGCGPADNSAIDYFGPKQIEKISFEVISKLQCPANEKSLRACNISSQSQQCPLGGLKCFNWKRIMLEKTCSGAVSYQSNGTKRSAVSAEGFSEIEGERLCNDLNCGHYKSKDNKKTNSSLTLSFNCSGFANPRNIWDCERSTTPTQKQLVIACDGVPNVTLSGKCHGKVTINGMEVCNSNWKESYSNMVCQEQNCSKIIINETVKKSGNHYYVNCEEHHEYLGQCKRFNGACEETVIVYCVGNVEFNTTEKCGGQVEVKYKDKWEKVCRIGESHLHPQLCGLLGCDSEIPKPSNIKKSGKTANLETRLDCTEDHNDIKHCVQRERCEIIEPAEIYCKGYVPQKIPDEKPKPIWPIILGIGFLLVLVILIVVFVRICIVKKAKNVSARIFSRKQVEFESGDVEDFTSKANEMEDFSHGRGFRSDAEFIEEHDARSTSSFSYDDIDEMDEDRPLTSQANTAGTSGDSYVPESALDQSADGVTYEVDDPQENYDDIEASPEITQTQAEVHDGPTTTPEREAVIAGLVQEDDDYLVPGQDG